MDETLSVIHEGAPKKKKLNTLLGGIHVEEGDDSDAENDMRDSTELGKINIAVNAHKKFDIK